MEAMQGMVTAIEGVAASPPYQDLILARSAAIAGKDFGPRGAFMGYDFHLSADGPRLIEINTNAGGAFLNGVACEAQRLCCPEMARFGTIACPEGLSATIAEMFRAEWRLQRGDGAPALIAIVDDVPEDQYLHPEFLLAQSLLTAQGLPTVITDPQAFEHHSGRLWLGDKLVDLVYNRLVDFDLSEPRHRALRDAYAAGEVLVTPNPRHHALLADKRNLVTLSDPAALQALGVSDADREALATIPRTQVVTAANAEEMWAARSGLFFKPVAGHGGKAVYRGDKLTRKVWATIPDGGYVAQQRIAPSERVVRVAGERQRHKVDVRLYTYGGEMLLAAARLYQGQTTNFRTPGGGFAPVMVA
jgi:glutathione synthase/RimK-type ligase-like ATP-grasp enzyme